MAQYGQQEILETQELHVAQEVQDQREQHAIQEAQDQHALLEIRTLVQQLLDRIIVHEDHLIVVDHQVEVHLQ
ncbi:hypothetical protein KAOT1_10606 [Kordia algicida OT-1]|uniref:Uncharacterized protein n=1 Tax=Kordia algicida OT-1 TaxID=391587 RepID=A9E2A9_9FLAO|nr:hypothetical protein KAOT1_10606 [Kordia algicida OT-1]